MRNIQDAARRASYVKMGLGMSLVALGMAGRLQLVEIDDPEFQGDASANYIKIGGAALLSSLGYFFTSMTNEQLILPSWMINVTYSTNVMVSLYGSFFSSDPTFNPNEDPILGYGIQAVGGVGSLMAMGNMLRNT